MRRILNWAKYSVLLLRKRILLTILVILQFTMSIFGISALIKYIMSQNTEMLLVRGLEVNNGVYYSGDESVIQDNLLTSTDIVMNIYITQGKVADKSMSIQAYTGRINELINIPLYKGKWFSDETTQKVEIVVSQSLGLKAGEQTQLIIADKSVECIIIGVLANNASLLRMRGGSSIGENMSTKFLFEESSDEDIVIMSYEQVEDKKLPGFIKGSNYYINFKEGISESELQKNMDILSQNGNVATITKMRENTNEEYQKMLMIFVPVMVLLCVLIVLSSILMVVLIMYTSKKDLSILYMYGASSRDMAGIVLCFGIIMTIIADILFLILDNVVLEEFIKNFGQNYISFVAMFVINIVQIVLITIFAKKVIRSKKILSSLKEEL